MKCSCLFFIAISGVFVQISGCQQRVNMADKSTAPEYIAYNGEPKIEFESMVYDFGKVGPSEKLNGEFKFTNTGDGLLKITKVEKCCGAVTTLNKDELAPGESGVLEVQYTSSRMANKMMKRLYVNSNDKEMPRATLTIKAETVVKVTYEPEKLQLKLMGENAGCPQITLTSVDNKLFSVKSFESSGRCVTAAVDPLVKDQTIVLRPVVDFDKLENRLSGIITIGLTHPDCALVTIYFTVLPRFKVTPPSLVLMRAEPHKPILMKITIESNYDEKFEVDSTSSKNGFIKVLNQHKTDKGYQFEVEITPSNAEDDGTFVDTLYVNVKNGEKLEIPCHGIYRTPK